MIIEMLKINGDWCADQSILKDAALAYYINLYTDKVTMGRPVLFTTTSYEAVLISQVAALQTSINSDEVRAVVFYMGALKALGSDGMNPYFYQSQILNGVTWVVQFVKWLLTYFLQVLFQGEATGQLSPNSEMHKS
ncbi:hypothetical protein Syun_021511 [Stephania yunnanensis]|uniref:Uncharacterized protein n=1 Tax=Stephania yunnanensis TaxID=152371 RepID=A0AAP0NQR1_9MAGN